MDFKKIIKVIFIDFMAVVLGILNGFIIPKFLNIDSYVYIKTFTLYIGYSGVLHLGFSDGMYILLGGKNINEILKGKLKGYILTVIKMVMSILVIILLVNVMFVRDEILNYFIVYTLPFQIVLFFSLLYRATGELNKYTKIRVGTNIFQLMATLSVLTWNESPYMYIFIQIIGYYTIAVILIFKLFSNTSKIERINNLEVRKLIRIGFLIMIANTANNLIFSLDRWIVKFNFSNVEFAYYSFGVSMMNLFIVLIGSLSVIFYPYIAKNREETSKYNSNMIRKSIFLITSLAPVGYFVMEIIVKEFIPQYKSSLNILGILILTIPFISIINIIYANFYKVLGMGKIYLKTCVKILVIGIILNLIGVMIWKNIIVIAIATLITLIIWYIYSNKHFEILKIDLNEKIYLVIYIFLYFLISNLNISSILKIMIFSGVLLGSAIFTHKEEIKFIKKIVQEKVKR